MRKEMESQNRGLYRESFEHDNCGIGAIVNIKGKKTHSTVAGALSIVEQLEHRAGKDAEGKTGDGVGILTQIPHGFFKKVCQPLGIKLKDERDYGVGMFFLPQDELKRNQAKKIFEVIVKKEGLKLLGWREVPIHPDILGKTAVDCMPCIMQAFIERPAKYERGIDFDRRLYVVRRIFEQSSDDTYVVSLSSRTIVYKGMFLVGQLRLFFEDLQDEEFISAIAMVHSRFSTNTAPSWQRAHPNRFMVHNGEINTIRGNADKMRAREETMEAGCLKGELHKVLPAINTSGSDSAMLDNALEFMVMSGMDLPLAVMICIPEPWINNKEMSQNKKDFYQYYATMMEPWDGPASILFSDGDVMGAVLDRNGLRPSRYYITDDDNLILSSEVGVLDIDPSKIVMKERLHPGKMLLVDTVAGRVIDDEELKEKYANQFPYGEWLDSNLIQLKDLKIPNKDVPKYTAEECTQLQKAFGYSYEDVKTSILTMAKNGAEGTAAMGMDAPISVLSQKRQPLFGYFKQLFAQVTNPPIDAIREEVVTSTTIYVGTDGNLLEQKEENCETEAALDGEEKCGAENEGIHEEIKKGAATGKEQAWIPKTIVSEVVKTGAVHDAQPFERLFPLEHDVQAWLDAPVGTLAKEIPAEEKLDAALHGSQMADFFNQIQLEETGADFSCTSLGNIPVGLPREVTMRDICNAYLFPNILFVLEVDEAVLRTALERCASYFAVEDGAVRISDEFLRPKVEHYNYDFYSGIRYTFDVRRPVGSRVVSLTKADGTPFGDKKYRLVMNNYRASGTGGYQIFETCPVLWCGEKEMPELIAEYIRKHSPVKVKREKTAALEVIWKG